MMNGAGFVTERGAIVPRWTPEHDAESEVVMDGKPLGFRVKDMLPERRWAVDAGGNVLERHDFNEKFKLWWQSHSKKEDPFVSIPDRREFVSGTYDMEGKGTVIGFDPGDPSKAVKSQKYTAEGEIYEKRRADDAGVAEQRGALRVLTALFKAGKISAEDYAERVMALDPAGSEPAADAEEEPAAEAEVGGEAATLAPREREVLELVGRTGPISMDRCRAIGEKIGMKAASVRAMAYKARAKVERGAA